MMLNLALHNRSDHDSLALFYSITCSQRSFRIVLGEVFFIGTSFKRLRRAYVFFFLRGGLGVGYPRGKGVTVKKRNFYLTLYLQIKDAH